MKASPTMVENLKGIRSMQTTGDARRVGCEMLLALARKEISAADVEAGAKMLASVSAMLHTEVKAHMVAAQLRKDGADIGKLAHIGQMLIGDTTAGAAAG